MCRKASYIWTFALHHLQLLRLRRPAAASGTPGIVISGTRRASTLHKEEEANKLAQLRSRMFTDQMSGGGVVAVLAHPPVVVARGLHATHTTALGICTELQVPRPTEPLLAGLAS